MTVHVPPSGNPPAQAQQEGENLPQKKASGWTIALIFLAVLVVLIVANM